MGRVKSKIDNGAGILDANEVKRRHEQLDGRVSDFVLSFLNNEGVSKSAFAEALGIAQGSLNSVLSSDPKWKGKHWSVPLLIRAANFFGVTVGELIGAAESGGAILLPRLATQLALTAPHTMDRLEKLVQAVAPEETSVNVLGVFYTAQMFEVAAPDYVHRYLDGELSDGEVYQLLRDAEREAPPNGNLWGEVKRRVGRNDNDVFSSANR